jgi:hypothetical protein
VDPIAVLLRFVAELRRRRLFRVTAVYLATAFALLQLGDVLIEPLTGC